MKKLIIWLALLLPFIANAQINGTIQKTASSGTIRGSFGSLGIDTIPRVTGVFVNGYILKYNASTNKWYASPDPTLVGLQDSLTKKANRTFDNVASGAIANVKLANSTISGVSLGSNLNALTLGNGLIGTSYNGSSAVTARVDTTTIQTVANFFPKGDTRYAKGVGDAVLTTGSQSVGGNKTFTSGIIITGGGLSTTAGLSATGTGVATSLQSTNNVLTTEFRTSTSVGFIGTDNNGLIFAPSSGTKSFELLSGGSVQVPSLNASGNIIVGADNNGTLGKIAIGSGLSLSSGTLTATGGSSGSVTTSGGTSGRFAIFTSASNIENSIVTQATNNITFGGTDGTEVITLQGGGNDRLGFNYSSSLMQMYSKNSLSLRLGSNLGTTGLTIFLGGVGEFNSNGVPLALSSNNSNTYKLQLRDVTTTRGFIGADSTNAFMVGNNNATSNLLTVNNSTGAVTASSFVGALTGNASTATALQTARTISGVSFDGTANITLNNNAITNGAGYITSSALTPYAPLASPALTGNPTAPTQTQGDNSTKIATTAYADGIASTVLAAQKQIANIYTNTSTTGTTTETLFTSNIAQSNLSADGDRIDFNFAGSFGLNANDKFVYLLIGGNTIAVSGNASNKSFWECEGYLLRTSLTTFRLFIRKAVDYVYSSAIADYTVTDFNPLNFSVLGQTNNASFPVTVQTGYLQGRKAP